jgi:predicted transcriptional regulator
MRTVRDIMDGAVVSLEPQMRVAQAAAILADHQISGAPVCAEDGRVVGVLSQSDLTGVFDDAGAKTVADVMTPEVLSVGADEPVERAIHTMAFEGVHRLVVVDGERRLAGIVTSMNVLRDLAGFRREDGRCQAVAPPEGCRRTS